MIVRLVVATIISSALAITIEDSVNISNEVFISDDGGGGELHAGCRAPIVIGQDVLIGPRVIIAPGVRIGDRAIVDAGVVVLTDIPNDVLVAGNPAH